MNDAGEKRFDATPSRVAKARREGNVARSAEVGAAVALAGGLLATATLCASLSAAFRAATTDAARGRPPWHGFAEIVALALIPAASAATCGILAGVLQSGGLNVVPPTAKLERLDPFKGLTRLFSRDALGQGLRAVAAFTCAIGAIALAARGVVVTASGTPAAAAGAAFAAAMRAAFAVCVLGTVFGALEFGVARAAWLRKLRMSYDEYRREMKEQDGDPQVRGRRRALHRTLSSGDVRRVREAAFVVCNPTHVAVALAYAPPVEPVPRVLVRAADDLAMRVREIAIEHGVPLIENVTLARALFADAVVGAPIPHDHYVAVASIVVELARAEAR
jgi:flagellar biosynthesis protein FlhB